MHTSPKKKAQEMSVSMRVRRPLLPQNNMTDTNFAKVVAAFLEAVTLMCVF